MARALDAVADVEKYRSTKIRYQLGDRVSEVARLIRRTLSINNGELSVQVDTLTPDLIPSTLCLKSVSNMIRM